MIQKFIYRHSEIKLLSSFLVVWGHESETNYSFCVLGTWIFGEMAILCGGTKFDYLFWSLETLWIKSIFIFCFMWL